MPPSSPAEISMAGQKEHEEHAVLPKVISQVQSSGAVPAGQSIVVEEQISSSPSTETQHSFLLFLVQQLTPMAGSSGTPAMEKSQQVPSSLHEKDKLVSAVQAFPV